MKDILGNNMGRRLDEYITGRYGEDQFKRKSYRKRAGRRCERHEISNCNARDSGKCTLPKCSYKKRIRATNLP